MSEFKKIETQEEFDSMVKDRLERQAKKTAEETEKKVAGWISPDEAAKQKAALEKQLADSKADMEKQLAELTGKLGDKEAAYNKLEGEKKALDLVRLKESAAREAGLPFELASRLSGETADELKADAESLSKLVNTGGGYVAPLYEAQPSGAGMQSDAAAYASLLDGLTNND